MIESTRNIELPVFENVIKLGFLLVNTLSKQQRIHKLGGNIFTLYSM